LLKCGEGNNVKVFGSNASTPMATRVLQVVTADERHILSGLIGGEMCDEPTITECGGIAIEHEHTVAVAG
jgi:hypothetical protein